VDWWRLVALFPKALGLPNALASQFQTYVLNRILNAANNGCGTEAWR
jgi:hypothetical protein